MRLADRVRNRAVRLVTWRWRNRRAVSDRPIIVIGGAPRSGTTLLRRLVDAHPAICCGPESSLLLPGRPSFPGVALDYGLDPGQLLDWYRRSDSQTSYVERVSVAYMKEREKGRWAEKTPLNVAHIDWTFRHFPQARFVHVMRDGRDASASVRHHPLRRLVDGTWVRVPFSRPFGNCVQAWDRLVRAGLRHRGDPRYMEIRYEDLVLQPERTLRGLFVFLAEPWAPEVMARTEPAGLPGAELDSTAAISDSRLGRWRKDLTPAERQVFKRLANPLLVELGYAADDRW